MACRMCEKVPLHKPSYINNTFTTSAITLFSARMVSTMDGWTGDGRRGVDMRSCDVSSEGKVTSLTRSCDDVVGEGSGGG